MNFDDLKTAEAAAKLLPHVDEAAHAYANGDHWQDGRGWIGPMLESPNPLTERATTYTERIFISEDVIGGAISRRATGIVGRPAEWYLADGSGNQNEELNNAMTAWAKKRKLRRIVRDSIRTGCYAHAPVRLYIPPGLIGEDGTLKADSLAAALNMIELEAADPNGAAVVTDKETGQEIGIYLFRKDNSQIAELVYINEAGQTVWRYTDERQGTELSTNGRLPMVQLDTPRLVNAAMLRNQRKINLAATAETENTITAGFVARLFLNAQMPGDYERNPDGSFKTDADGRRIFKSDPMVLGGNSVNFMVGVATTDENGTERLAAPSYMREEPSSPDTFVKSKTEARRVMLEAASQAHVMESGDAAFSGESRLRARQEFRRDLEAIKGDVDAFIGEIIEAALSLAAAISSQPNPLEAGTAVFVDTRIDAGALTAGELTAVAGLVKDGVISHHTGLVWMGIDDADAELAKIAKEQGSSDKTATAA